MNQQKVSIILHYMKDAPYGKDGFIRSVKSILKQSFNNIEIIVIGDKTELNADIPVHFINTETTLGKSLNKAFQITDSPYFMYIDNRNSEVNLKLAAVDLCLLAVHQEKNCGLIYSDYEISENGQIKEIHLLKHHIGRVRDNQDYGKVFFFTEKALEEVNFCDESLKFNTLYDLRLKISEKYKLIHIANRYAGSLYTVKAEGKSHNVFDYLLASKESQTEAEKVLGNHLKRIGANLEAGSHYNVRPEAPKEANLKASVIIPVNNRPKFIETAIESIQAQTVREVEAVIVVNGGENDPTIDAVKRYLPGGDKYDSNKPAVQLLVYDINNLGLCLNKGAWNAKGEYYVQLDSDDRLKPDAVEKILAVYEEDPNIGMVIGSYEVWEMKENGELKRMEDLPVVTHDEWTEENGRNNLLRIGGAGAPRSIPIQLIRDIGFSLNQEPYSRNYGEDYGMVLKISEKHRIGRVWDAVYEVIRHSGGTDHSIDQETIDRNDEAKDFLRKETILRRIELNKN